MKKLACSLLLAVAALATAGPAAAGVFISVNIAPPVLPVYEQPPCPAPDYIWIPGYWAWDPNVGAYYWVPGTWVLAPQPGLLWTPGWWGWSAGVYVWHPGYWAPHVGFYGGVNYGFGYYGTGFVGGYWQGPHFYYNQAVNNVNVTVVHNVYVNKTVVHNVTVNRVAYNGGPGGLQVRPTPADLRVERERHWQPTQEQLRQVDLARENRAQFVGAHGSGRPQVLATPRPGAFGRNENHENRGGPALGHESAAPAVPQRPQAPMAHPMPAQPQPRVVEPRPEPNVRGPQAHPQPMPPRLQPRIEQPPPPREGHGNRPLPAYEPRIVQRATLPQELPAHSVHPQAGPLAQPWQTPPTRAPVPIDMRQPQPPPQFRPQPRPQFQRAQPRNEPVGRPQPHVEHGPGRSMN